MIEFGGEGLDPFAASVLTLDRVGDAWRRHVPDGLADWRDGYVAFDPDGALAPALGRGCVSVAPGEVTLDPLGDLRPWRDAEAWSRAVNCIAVGLSGGLVPSDLGIGDEGDAAQAMVLGLLITLPRKGGATISGVAKSLDGGARWLLSSRQALRARAPSGGPGEALAALDRALPGSGDADRLPRLRALDAGCRAAAACLRRAVAARPHLAAGRAATSTLVGGRVAVRVDTEADAALAASLFAVGIISLPEERRRPVLFVVPEWERLLGGSDLGPVLVDLTRPRQERVAGLWAFVLGGDCPDGGLRDEMLEGGAVMVTAAPRAPGRIERLLQAARGARPLLRRPGGGGPRPPRHT